ncbi:uncharacterized protein TNIN_337911 [Trichonephila inaurata madagascariensis]|uniref:Uncharacterized protein n=1 Tax=Trichonephila inaurata madagascariensis TaxID=2747483 RepID=A0A8X6X9F0_9ARAC|nr:uncharacterized protein TNIN_337911 [Trichonephila inaurata madagascariensis]
MAHKKYLNKREIDIFCACESIKDFVIDQCILDSGQEDDIKKSSEELQISEILQTFSRLNMYSAMNIERRKLFLARSISRVEKFPDSFNSLSLHVHSLSDEMIEDMIEDFIYTTGIPRYWNHKILKNKEMEDKYSRVIEYSVTFWKKETELTYENKILTNICFPKIPTKYPHFIYCCGTYFK